MKINIRINDQPYIAREGETILEVLNTNGYKIPTLCHLENLAPNSSCRMCVVEIKTEQGLRTACSSIIADGMEIYTHSEKVIQARRTNLMLLLASHPDDCLNCEKNTRCDLQKLAGELNISEKRFRKANNPSSKDLSSPSVIRDLGKCIRCGRCVEICSTIIGCQTFKFSGSGSDYSVRTAFEKALNLSSCVQCGQCVVHCPTAALTEKSHVQKVIHQINIPDQECIIMVEPAAAYAIMQLYSSQTIKNAEEFTISILKKAGFSKVFSSGFGNDLMLDATTKQLQLLLNQPNLKLLITSSCPSWVRYAEQHMPQVLPMLNKVKSGPQILASMILNDSNQAAKPYIVLLTSCTGRKMEALRSENQPDGKPTIDAILNIRDMEQLIALRGIDVDKTGIQPYDQPYSKRSSSSVLCAGSGGELEGILRYYLSKEYPKAIIHKISELRTAKNYKEATIQIARKESIKVAAISGLGNVEENIQNAIESGCQLIEIMACPGGCMLGGGRNYSQSEKYQRQVIRAIYETDTRDIMPVIDIPEGLYADSNPSTNMWLQKFMEHEVIR